MDVGSPHRVQEVLGRRLVVATVGRVVAVATVVVVVVAKVAEMAHLPPFKVHGVSSARAMGCRRAALATGTLLRARRPSGHPATSGPPAGQLPGAQSQPAPPAAAARPANGRPHSSWPALAARMSLYHDDISPSPPSIHPGGLPRLNGFCPP